MLRDGIRALFDDRRRGDDRAPSAGAAPARIGKPPVLGRWTIRLFALLGILAIIYGTLAPFQIDPGRAWSWNLRWHPLLPGDAAANVLVYVPIGVFLRLLLRRRGSRWLTECLVGLILAAGLSYLTEVCQTVLARRVPSWVDLYCNLAGAAAGLAIAPLFQRVLRNHHAWLYAELRVRPFGAAASAAILLVAAAALLPFDLQPTPAHLAAALDHVRYTPLSFPWTAFDNPAVPLEPVQLFDKLAAAACFALVAFLLTLAQAEARRPRFAAAWYALTRTIALAATIEMLQLFTIAHVADPRDLLMAWSFAGLGAIAGSMVLWHYSTDRPRPGNVLRGLVVVLAVGVAARTAAVAACMEGRPTTAIDAWLPMTGLFDQPWNHLLYDYLTSLLLYVLLAGLLVLWSRSRGRRPRGLTLATLVGLAALAELVAGAFVGRPPDTAQILLALAAACLVLRCDRALFEHRRLIDQKTPADRTLS